MKQTKAVSIPEREAAIDLMIQEAQDLGSMHLRFLESVQGVGTAEEHREHLDDLLQAFARSYISYRSAISAAASDICDHDGLEVKADWDF